MLNVRRPDRPPSSSARAGYLLLPGVARALGKDSAIQGANGMEHPLGLVR
jgi:hypothetical protein